MVQSNKTRFRLIIFFCKSYGFLIIKHKLVTLVYEEIQIAKPGEERRNEFGRQKKKWSARRFDRL